MEIKYLIKKIIITALVIVVCFLFQVSFFPYIQLAGVVPNLLIIVASTYGFLKGKKVGIIVGFACGILLDLFSANYFGLYALIYMCIGFLCGFFRTMFYGDDMKLPLLMIGVCDIISGLGIYLIGFLFRGRINIFYYFKSVILPEAVYTIMIAVFLYYILLRINLKLEEDENRRNKRIG